MASGEEKEEIQNRDSKWRIERGGKTVTEGCIKFIVFKQESNFKLASEINRNPVKKIMDKGQRFISSKAQN